MITDHLLCTAASRRALKVRLRGRRLLPPIAEQHRSPLIVNRLLELLPGQAP